MARSASSSCGYLPPLTAPTTPCCKSTTGAGRCRATRPKALIVAARKAGLEEDALDARFARVAEVPFSSERN